MSIQSAQSDVLRQMKRQYRAEQVSEALNKIASQLPHAFVGMDVIAGFPTETDEQFDETVERLSGLSWTRLHVFPYSRRPGTFCRPLSSIARNSIENRASRSAK